ncbi:hypothetical protein HOY82DRAFT_548071, partial [Tuber indicum]
NVNVCFFFFSFFLPLAITIQHVGSPLISARLFPSRGNYSKLSVFFPFPFFPSWPTDWLPSSYFDRLGRCRMNVMWGRKKGKKGEEGEEKKKKNKKIYITRTEILPYEIICIW